MKIFLRVGKLQPIGTVRLGLTCFATSYLTLECLLELKDALVRMWTCKGWKCSATLHGKGMGLWESHQGDGFGPRGRAFDFFWSSYQSVLLGQLR